SFLSVDALASDAGGAVSLACAPMGARLTTSAAPARPARARVCRRVTVPPRGIARQGSGRASRRKTPRLRSHNSLCNSSTRPLPPPPQDGLDPLSDRISGMSEQPTSPAETTNPYGTGAQAAPQKRIRVPHLQKMKETGQKWAMLTAYDMYA